MNTHLLRQIPGVHELLENPQAAQLGARAQAKRALQGALDALRRDIQAGAVREINVDDIFQAARKLLAAPALMRVINGTGVILHTNLGRAPMSHAAAQAAYDAARRYTALETDPHSGKRISRHSHVEDIICRLTGFDAAMALNNNAAAIMLALAIIKPPREILVSRGELVEIGGGFRVPDVLRAAGARLVEVGCTNRTYAADYARALKPGRTGAILRVHPSNFAMSGFVASPKPADLAAIARQARIPLIEDLGSGLLIAPDAHGIHNEPTVRQSAKYADVVTFSADKLPGGPQAGIVCARTKIIARMKRHPLARALRVDKMCLAALLATLQHYENSDPTQTIPTLHMLTASIDEMRKKARALAGRLPILPDVQVQVADTEAQAGGGTLPQHSIASAGVAITHATRSAGCIAQAFRSGGIPIIGRVQQKRFVLDVRTLFDDDFDVIAQRFAEIMG